MRGWGRWVWLFRVRRGSGGRIRARVAGMARRRGRVGWCISFFGGLRMFRVGWVCWGWWRMRARVKKACERCVGACTAFGYGRVCEVEMLKGRGVCVGYRVNSGSGCLHVNIDRREIVEERRRWGMRRLHGVKDRCGTRNRV